MKLLDKIFGKKETGFPCWVLANQSDDMMLRPALIKTSLDQVIELEYEWIDGSRHTYITGKDEYRTKIENKPVYIHKNIGSCFSDNRESNISSEYFNKIVASNIGSQMLNTLEEFQEGTKIPWKWILIISGVIILGVVLWQTGILQSLFDSLAGSVPTK